ncbi:MAG: bifunctional demethylmenaquinone methyltransferase/2-methoxy-6-polyprenyl-1,4-benzoquinol methylase UbiE [Bordetella sp.]|nr:MAG: bifunctional demethylmenaquinone methyltransferase/2-methoxy-6-polyprenyl-1,4-benzoquinol methylase UbiE [Bordetella sp.]
MDKTFVLNSHNNRSKIVLENSNTHFGFQSVSKIDKTRKVYEIFHSVAWRYDIMNDLMSLGLHRLWKLFVINQAYIRPGMKILDIAGGTGDLAKIFAKKVGSTGEVWLTDINDAMLYIGRDRLINSGIIIPVVACDAEYLPFPSKYFDRVCVAFGLRNMTNKDVALQELTRVLKLGGKALILDFSKIVKFLSPIYDWYSFNILPFLGRKIVNDESSYRYLAESIRVHPNQTILANMMLDAGLRRVRYFNMSGGIVALHEGVKLF